MKGLGCNNRQHKGSLRQTTAKFLKEIENKLCSVTAEQRCFDMLLKRDLGMDNVREYFFLQISID
jgi:hypothetical protein